MQLVFYFSHSRNYTHLSFITSRQDEPKQAKVQVTIDGTVDSILGGLYTYVEDPVVTAISPTTSLIS